METRYKSIPENLIKKGYNLNTIGVNEYAWEKKEIKKILEMLEMEKLFIMGGDVYKLVDGKIEYTVDGWYAKKDEDSYKKAIQYIDTYEAMNGKGFIYSLVF